MESNRKVLGGRLKSIRKTVGLSRAEISRKHGFSARSIELWESGQTEIGALKLSEYLGVFKLHYGIEVSISALVNFENDLLINQKIAIK